MRRLIAVLVLVLASPAWAAGPSFRVGAHITTQTTTTIVTGVAGQTVSLQGGSICVDANGVTTGITIQDSGATNLVGTGVVYVLSAGQCLAYPRVQDLYYAVTRS